MHGLATEKYEVTTQQIARFMKDEFALRTQCFSGQNLSENSWQVLLAIFASTEKNQDMSVAALSTLGGMHATTGLRWIELLKRNGLVEISPGREIHNKTLVLTKQGKSKMERYLERVAKLGLECVAA